MEEHLRANVGSLPCTTDADTKWPTHAPVQYWKQFQHFVNLSESKNVLVISWNLNGYFAVISKRRHIAWFLKSLFKMLPTNVCLSSVLKAIDFVKSLSPRIFLVILWNPRLILQWSGREYSFLHSWKVCSKFNQPKHAPVQFGKQFQLFVKSL